jgi:predicted metal-dependent phosphoesterase TrpH
MIKMLAEGAAYDLHVHSRYSKDSLLPPGNIIEAAKSKGLSGVAITDHGTVRGGIAVRRVAPRDLKVIVGYEARIRRQDIICLFVEEVARAETVNELCEMTRENGGITILAHPYRLHLSMDEEEAGAKVDAIEVLNARLSKDKNRRAAELAERLHMPKVAGSDAHSGSEIGKAFTILDRDQDPREAILRGLTSAGGSEALAWSGITSLLTRATARALNAIGG